MGFQRSELIAGSGLWLLFTFLVAMTMSLAKNISNLKLDCFRLTQTFSNGRRANRILVCGSWRETRLKCPCDRGQFWTKF